MLPSEAILVRSSIDLEAEVTLVERAVKSAMSDGWRTGGRAAPLSQATDSNGRDVVRRVSTA
ncbi:MAG: hypothetical protein Q8K82_02030 [Gemmatimonadaceae bacterium]|nr:hypothetical protein [Gemmatimonadaceae bacterium]